MCRKWDIIETMTNEDKDYIKSNIVEKSNLEPHIKVLSLSCDTLLKEGYVYLDENKYANNLIYRLANLGIRGRHHGGYGSTVYIAPKYFYEPLLNKDNEKNNQEESQLFDVNQLRETIRDISSTFNVVDNNLLELTYETFIDETEERVIDFDLVAFVIESELIVDAKKKIAIIDIALSRLLGDDNNYFNELLLEEKFISFEELEKYHFEY